MLEGNDKVGLQEAAKVLQSRLEHGYHTVAAQQSPKCYNCCKADQLAKICKVQNLKLVVDSPTTRALFVSTTPILTRRIDVHGRLRHRNQLLQKRVLPNF